MKKLLIILIAASFALSGCSDSKRIDGKIYEPYGLFNKEEIRDPSIHYELVTGNLVWGVLLCSTIIAPVYFFGFDLYEPISKRSL
jgi:hypothetical protein